MPSAPTSPTRLSWFRIGPGDFIAYPIEADGEDDQHRARVFYSEHDGRWYWLVEWPGRFRAGAAAESKQDAADRATEAWYREIERTAGASPNQPPTTYDLRPIEAMNVNMGGGGG